jgi:magnesium transporter
VPEWIDLVDPTEDELRRHLPADVHGIALRQLLAPHQHDDEPRPHIESHGKYVLGVLLLPIEVPNEDRLYYQEVDFVAMTDRLLTVSKTPPGEKPFDPAAAKDACREDDPVGMYVYHLLEEIAEGFLTLVDELDDEIDELEDRVADRPPEEVGRHIRGIRHDILGIRRTLGPTRDAVRKILEDRVEIDDGELFPRPVEIALGSTYDKLLRSSEGLDGARDAIGGVRDYLQGKIANDQNQVMKRLTIVASLLLVPTFIVGVYGQNFRHIPELTWIWGYWWSWGWIVATTAAQLVFFRWKRWL